MRPYMVDVPSPFKGGPGRVPGPGRVAHPKKISAGKVKPCLRLCCRDEATRTPDPSVPNVVRYQLRYIPFAGAKVQLIFQLLAFFFKKICGNR